MIVLNALRHSNKLMCAAPKQLRQFRASCSSTKAEAEVRQRSSP